MTKEKTKGIVTSYVDDGLLFYQKSYAVLKSIFIHTAMALVIGIVEVNIAQWSQNNSVTFNEI